MPQRWDENGNPIPEAPQRWDERGNPVSSVDADAVLRTMSENQARFDRLKPRWTGSAGAKPKGSRREAANAQMRDRSAAARPRRGQARSASQEVTQGLATFNSGVPLFDETAAMAGMVGNLVTGKGSFDPEAAWQSLQQTGSPAGALGAGLRPAYDQAMADQRGLEEDFQARRPVVANFTRSTGTAASSVLPGGPLVNSGRGMNALRGATVAGGQGAIYGVTDRGDLDERLEAGRNNAVLSAVVGGAAGALARPNLAPKPGKPAKPSDASILREAGVDLTPGQALGGPAKSMEEAATRLPILGGRIRGARARGAESWNRAIANRPLASINESLPANVTTGPEAVGYVSRRLGQEFEKGYALVPDAQADDLFMQGTTSRLEPYLAELTPQNRQMLRGILRQRLNQFDKGPVSGPDAGRIRSELAGKASDYRGSSDPNQRVVGEALEQVVDELDALIARSDPTGQAGPILSRAREGWASFSVLRRAGANSRDGSVTPAQLATAVRVQDQSVGKGATARGEARMQDLALAGNRVMSGSFRADPVMDGVGYTGLLGLTAANPAVGAGAVAGLSVLAAPYAMMARNIANRVPETASKAEALKALRAIDSLIERRPEIARPLEEARARLMRLAGAASSTTSTGPEPGQ